MQFYARVPFNPIQRVINLFSARAKELLNTNNSFVQTDRTPNSDYKRFILPKEIGIFFFFCSNKCLLYSTLVAQRIPGVATTRFSSSSSRVPAIVTIIISANTSRHYLSPASCAKRDINRAYISRAPENSRRIFRPCTRNILRRFPYCLAALENADGISF